MKIGFVISMYDEINIVNETIKRLHENKCVIIVIQSDPGDKKKIVDSEICDFYEMMSDISNGNYREKIEQEHKEKKPEFVGPKALTRNFSKGFSIIKNFDVDYVVAITGDTKITSLDGILKIIKKMENSNKMVGGTRNVGYDMWGEDGELNRFQDKKSTQIMPQFFITSIFAVKNGLFCEINRTNKYNTEQCLGDEILRYCKENNLKFLDYFYRICDFAYPRFLEGIEYNPEQLSKIPQIFEIIINKIRYENGETINHIITKIFTIIEKSNNKNN